MNYEVKTVEKVLPEVHIVDPSDSRIMQWLNVSTRRGLIELNLPLSDEPNLGIWNINWKENENDNSFLKASFEVKKYVLPKFELILDHHKAVSHDDKILNVTVCAKLVLIKNFNLFKRKT